MNIKILKCHGSGNDFILIDEYSSGYKFSQKDRAEIAKALCNRKGSLGADGILYFTKSDIADGGMRIINADGSEAEMCGNGIRCLGRYATELLKKENVLIETLKEVLPVKKMADLFSGVKTFQVTIKPVKFDVESLPMNFSKSRLENEEIPGFVKGLKFTALSLPNPHIVSIVEEIDEKYITEVGGKANTDKSIFPRGVNLNFVKSVGENAIYVQTYERGVGLTNACGTGMSASTLVSCLLGINTLESVVDVFNRGGMVKCQPKLNEDGEYTVELIGNATYVFEGDVELSLENPDEFIFTKTYEFTDDINNYEKLAEFAKSII